MFFVWSISFIDPDFGWHLRSGQYFIENGIPKTDIYTYTAQDFPWVNHEWLSDTLLARLAMLDSYWIIAAIYAALWTSTLAIVGRKIHAALIVLAAFALLPFLGVRALTWSVVGLALLMLLLRQENTRWRLLIPPLFLLWANMHGSFLIGIIYGGWWVLKERSWKLLLLGAISLLLTVCNPYGVEIYTEVFRTMLDTNLHNRVAEWARFAIPLGSVAYTLVWLGITVQHGRDWKKYIRLDILLFLMSISSVRMVPLFILVSLPYLAEDIKSIGRNIKSSGTSVHIQRKVKQIAIWTVVIGAPALFIVSQLPRPGAPKSQYPNEAVTYLREHPCRGNIFNSYDYGGYLIWKLPEHKVYIDGRMPSWSHNGTNYMEDYLRIKQDVSFRREQFSRYNITCVLVENGSAMLGDLRKAGWRETVNDGTSTLLIAPARS